MPIRTASMSRRIAKNGATLHLAMTQRIDSLGADHEPSEAEHALAEERRTLKEERARRQARAQREAPHGDGRDEERRRPGMEEEREPDGDRRVRHEEAQHEPIAAAVDAAHQLAHFGAREAVHLRLALDEWGDEAPQARGGVRFARRPYVGAQRAFFGGYGHAWWAVGRHGDGRALIVQLIRDGASATRVTVDGTVRSRPGRGVAEARGTAARREPVRDV